MIARFEWLLGGAGCESSTAVVDHGVLPRRGFRYRLGLDDPDGPAPGMSRLRPPPARPRRRAGHPRRDHPHRRGASPPGRETLGRLGARAHRRHDAGRAPGALHAEQVEDNLAAGTDPASADQTTGRQVGRGTRGGAAMRWGPPCRNTGKCPGRGVATLTGCRSVRLATSNGANRPYAGACAVVSSTRRSSGCLVRQIPGLYGADAAAARLAELDPWKREAIPVTEDRKGEQS